MTIKDIFQLELSNRFNALYWEDQEQDIESEWTAGRDIIKKACKEVLRKKLTRRKNGCLIPHGKRSKKGVK